MQPGAPGMMGAPAPPAHDPGNPAAVAAANRQTQGALPDLTPIVHALAQVVDSGAGSPEDQQALAQAAQLIASVGGKESGPQGPGT